MADVAGDDDPGGWWCSARCSGPSGATGKSRTSFRICSSKSIAQRHPRTLSHLTRGPFSCARTARPRIAVRPAALSYAGRPAARCSCTVRARRRCRTPRRDGPRHRRRGLRRPEHRGVAPRRAARRLPRPGARRRRPHGGRLPGGPAFLGDPAVLWAELATGSGGADAAGLLLAAIATRTPPPAHRRPRSARRRRTTGRGGRPLARSARALLDAAVARPADEHPAALGALRECWSTPATSTPPRPEPSYDGAEQLLTRAQRRRGRCYGCACDGLQGSARYPSSSE